MSWNERKGHSQSGTGPGEFGPDYSYRKQYHLGETKMACDNIDCSCEGCTCDPCTCTPDNLCGCDDADHSNDWKGLV